MIEKKFRGKSIQTGEYVYGDLIHCHKDLTYIKVKADHPMFDMLMDIWKLCEEVDPDSVSQLVKIDKDGNEIYEDDIK